MIDDYSRDQSVNHIFGLGKWLQLDCVTMITAVQILDKCNIKLSQEAASAALSLAVKGLEDHCYNKCNWIYDTGESIQVIEWILAANINFAVSNSNFLMYWLDFDEQKELSSCWWFLSRQICLNRSLLYSDNKILLTGFISTFKLKKLLADEEYKENKILLLKKNIVEYFLIHSTNG